MAKLKRIKKEIDNEINKIKDKLFHDKNIPEGMDEIKLKNIINQASEDIYSVINNDDLFGRINLNYHMNISYFLDDVAKNYVIKNKIRKKCQDKFFYESNDSSESIIDFNKKNNIKDKKMLLTRLNKVLVKYQTNLAQKYPECECNLDGIIRKLFLSLKNYHCEELLNDIEDEDKISEEVVCNIKDAPILWITKYLFELGIENKIIRIIVREHVRIDWGTIDRSLIPHSNNISYNYSKEYRSDMLDKMKQLSGFYSFSYYLVNKDKNSQMTIVFSNMNKYHLFKKNSFELTSVFKYIEDVKYIFKNEHQFDNIIMLEFNDECIIDCILKNSN